jgi:TRAP-type C4-dicarboxylate transport system permease small subunit
VFVWAFFGCVSDAVDVTRDIIAQRVAAAARRLLFSCDPEIVKMCAVIATAAFGFNVLSSRTARQYSVRAIKHGSTLVLMVATIALTGLYGLQSLAGSRARPSAPEHQLTAPPVSAIGALRRLVSSSVSAQTATLLPPASVILLLFFLMRLRVTRH